MPYSHTTVTSAASIDRSHACDRPSHSLTAAVLHTVRFGVALLHSLSPFAHQSCRPPSPRPSFVPTMRSFLTPVPCVLLVVLALVVCCSVSSVSGQSCSCVGCVDTASVAAGSTTTVFMTSPCADGSYAAASNVNAASTDGSGFNIRLYNPTGAAGSQYTAGSASSVTCFRSPFATNIGGPGYSKISVDIKCNNVFQACPIKYNIDFTCIGGTVDKCAGVACGAYGSCSSSTGTCICTDGYSGSSCQIAPTPSPTPTPTPTPSGGNTPTQPTGSSCGCACCTGNYCSVTMVGFVPVSSCSNVDCDSQCRSTFASCPASGTPGTVGSQCGTKSGAASLAASGIIIAMLAGAALQAPAMGL
jgi:hypothetical protein